MQIWKVIWMDGTESYVRAETKYQVLTEIYPGKAYTIREVLPLVRNCCEDRTSPWALAGLPGHRSKAPNSPNQALLVKSKPQLLQRLKMSRSGLLGALQAV